MTDDEIDGWVQVLSASWSSINVDDKLGPADKTEEGFVPAKSGVGMQETFWVKLRPGEPYLLWQYSGESTALLLFFAKVYDSWMLASRAQLPLNCGL